MGGDSVDDPSTFFGTLFDDDDDEVSSIDEQFAPILVPVSPCFGDKTAIKEKGSAFGNVGEEYPPFSSAAEDSNVNLRNRNAYREVLNSYDDMRVRIGSMTEAKRVILSYHPGDWIEQVGSSKLHDFNVPESTCLLLIGPKGSGKSSLVNRISKVFENDKFAPDRAQVSYNSSAGDGTFFVQQYMIPKGLGSFCLFDTRGLSSEPFEDAKMLKRWMTEGVRHGELVLRESDDKSLRKRMKWQACHRHVNSEIRMVNFVIFVVNGLEVLKSMEASNESESSYSQMISTAFNCPFLSFKDSKPAVVVTHGDLLTITDRARVRVRLGELLGVHPAKHIFDIPESCGLEVELSILDMLRYTLENADRNLPHKTWSLRKEWRLLLSTWLYLLLIVGIAIIAASTHHARQASRKHHRTDWPSIHVDWSSIRHLWLDN